jgi:hypothetical protein
LASPLRCRELERAERRRRRLATGIDRWVRDVKNDDRGISRVHLVTLTVAKSEPDAAEGAMRNLMHHLHKLDPTLRYFWWSEFQRRGVIHYHGIFLDPPTRTTRQTSKWLRAHWTLGELWPKVLKRDAKWFDRAAGAYVGAYAKKFDGPKSYQQSYERMPRGWHVFASNRLVYPIAVHELHENQAELVCAAANFSMRGTLQRWPSQPVPWYERLANTWVVAVEYHTPAPGGCRLDRSRRRRAPSNKHSSRTFVAPVGERPKSRRTRIQTNAPPLAPAGRSRGPREETAPHGSSRT